MEPGTARRFGSLVVAGLAIFASMGMPAAAQSQSPDQPVVAAQRAIVVIDNSLAMLAPIETFKKSFLVRKDLQGPVSVPPPGVEIGLLTYGHRNRGACDDIEMLIPVGAVESHEFFRNISDLRPHGKAPLADGLTAAAAALAEGGHHGGRLLLVAASPDTCQGDPCAAVKALVTADPGLSISVVWLADADSDLTQAQCIAQTGNGRLQVAKTMADAEQMLGDAFANLGDTPPATDQALPATPIRKAPGLMVSLRLGPQAAAYAGKVDWTIRKSQADKQGAVVARGSEATLTSALPVGSYEVEANAGGMSLQQAVDVRDKDASEAVLILNAGIVQLRTTGSKSGQSQPDVFVTIYRLGATADDPSETVAVVPLAQQTVLLAEGKYRAVAALQDIQVEQTFSVVPGTSIGVDFGLSNGVLQIDTPVPEEAPPASGNIAYFISEDDPEQPLGQRDISRSAMPNPSFVLKPGLYHIYARAGAAQARVDAVVRAGETTKVSLPVITGRLLMAPMGLADGSEIPKDLISYTIEKLDSAGAPEAVIARSNLGDARIDLEAGHYRVTGRVGLVNVVASADTVIRPGAETRITLHTSLALLNLRFGDAPEGVSDVLWEIRKADGTVLWSTTSATPLVPLAPGDYDVHALRAGKDRSIAVTLVTDERRTVVIRPD